MQDQQYDKSCYKGNNVKQVKGERRSNINKLLKKVRLGEVNQKEGSVAIQLVIKEVDVFCEETNDIGNVREIKKCVEEKNLR